ncbi:MAG: fatty acyl-AMP ligase [Alphaproteobacteria bacterium]
MVELLRWRARHQTHDQGYVFLAADETERARLTYGELDSRARALAATLQGTNAVGERALLLFPPGRELEFVVSFFGCLYAGVIAVPAMTGRPKRRDRRLEVIALDAGAKFALTTASLVADLRQQLSDGPHLETLRWVATDRLDEASPEDWQPHTPGADELAFLQYTSGATAVPKGAMVSHGNLLSNALMMRDAFDHPEESVTVGWLPLHHDMGLIGNVLQALYVGAPSILMSPMAFLQRPIRWLRTISRYRARSSGGPNFAYELCVRKITPEQRETLDLSSWSLAFTGAEPIRAETVAAFSAAFEPCGFDRKAFYPCYGLAEATLFVSGGLRTASPIIVAVHGAGLKRDRVVEAGGHEKDAQLLVGCGRCWGEERIVIVDPTSGIECRPGNIGEIWVSGPNVVKGYWNRAKETEQTFRAFLEETGEGPFLRTGDLGFVKDGELFVTGRLKDLIIIDGRNHYPQDIEFTVERSHPSLRPGCCAAFSVDVAREEQLVVVGEIDHPPRRNQGSTPEHSDIRRNPERSWPVEDMIKSILRAVAENHDVAVHAIALLAPGGIPKTSSGKIQRRLCTTRYLSGSLPVVFRRGEGRNGENHGHG